MPFSRSNAEKVSTKDTKEEKAASEPGIKGPGGLVKVFKEPAEASAPGSDNASGVVRFLPLVSTISAGTFIPYINMNHAQLSFHGHKDTVRFFMSARGDAALDAHTIPSKLVVVSGGDGYIDFRVGEDDDAAASPPQQQATPKDVSHLIVWNIDSTENTPAAPAGAPAAAKNDKAKP